VTGAGTYTFTAANGDRLVAAHTGSSALVGPGVVLITEHAVIDPTGSTGRFAGAEGTFTVERLADPATRATLVDEGLPPATTSIAAEVANVLLSTVAGPDEVLAVVGARIDLKVHAVGPTLDVDVVHQGELVLAPQDDGSWRIESFALHTARDSRA
jgi:hypothetical protein